MPATARALAHRLPWIAASGGWFLIWRPSTRKSGLLLLVGYLVGSAVGLVTGLLMGWPPRAD